MKGIKIELKWAIIFTIVYLLWMLMEKASGLHNEHIDKQPIFTLFFGIPAIIIYILALRDKKKNDYKGRISFVQIFTSGIILSLMIALRYRIRIVADFQALTFRLNTDLYYIYLLSF